MAVAATAEVVVNTAGGGPGQQDPRGDPRTRPASDWTSVPDLGQHRSGCPGGLPNAGGPVFPALVSGQSGAWQPGQPGAIPKRPEMCSRASPESMQASTGVSSVSCHSVPRRAKRATRSPCVRAQRIATRAVASAAIPPPVAGAYPDPHRGRHPAGSRAEEERPGQARQRATSARITPPGAPRPAPRAVGIFGRAPNVCFCARAMRSRVVREAASRCLPGLGGRRPARVH
jgi:hypothetical protein